MSDVQVLMCGKQNFMSPRLKERTANDGMLRHIAWYCMLVYDVAWYYMLQLYSMVLYGPSCIDTVEVILSDWLDTSAGPSEN